MFSKEDKNEVRNCKKSILEKENYLDILGALLEDCTKSNEKALRKMRTTSYVCYVIGIISFIEFIIIIIILLIKKWGV